MFWQGMTLKQRILDTICIAMCVAALTYLLIVYAGLPDQIPTNYDFNGEVASYGKKSSLFFIVGIMFLMTATFSVILRLKAFYRHMNLPWTVPWGKMPLVVSETKDMLCWCNLCVTIGNAYLLYGSLTGNLSALLVWAPYLALTGVLIWYLLRLRRICKG